jgi:hypothetical protein
MTAPANARPADPPRNSDSRTGRRIRAALALFTGSTSLAFAATHFAQRASAGHDTNGLMLAVGAEVASVALCVVAVVLLASGARASRSANVARGR